MVNAEDVADLLVHSTVERFGDEIAIIAAYGSRARDEAADGSDLDIFYIPVADADPPAARAFVVDGLAVDFWPIRWETAERIAAGRFRNWAVAPGILRYAKVLHARTEEDRARFSALPERIAALEAPESRGEMVRRALEAFPGTLLHLENLRRSEEAEDTAGVRVAAARLVESALDCLALANQRTFAGGWHVAIRQADRLAARPESLAARAAAVLTAPDSPTVRRTAEALVADTRRALRDRQETAVPPPDPARVFHGAYAEIREHVDKLIAACAEADRVRAALEAVTVQDEIARLLGATRSGVGYGAFNGYREYGDLFEREGFPSLLEDTSDLPRLAARARALDGAVRTWLQSAGVERHVFSDIETLRNWIAG